MATEDNRSPLERLVQEVGAEHAAQVMQERYGAGWKYQWRGCWARPSQIPPDGNWRTFMFLAGRGSGKTRAASEWVKERVRNGSRRIALIARTSADVRDVLVEGEGGIMSVYPDHEKPLYEPSKRRLTWKNGAIATTYSAEEGSALRGPQHDSCVADELAAWEDTDVWDQMRFGLRLGQDPRVMVTTTPRPKPLIRKLLKDPTCVVRRASSFENRSNLAPQFLQEVIKSYEGTRLGRQEIYAEILEDSENSLWTQTQLEKIQVKEAPEMARVVVGVDPSKGNKSGSNDEQGIVACGQGMDGLYYVLADRSCLLTPEGWAGRAVELARQLGAACISVETNAGGQMATSVIEQAAKARGVNVRIKPVVARSGKGARAEPVSALYERGSVRHLPGLEKLEEEQVHMTPGGYEGSGSPNRIDALCWSLLELSHVKVVSGEIDEKLDEWVTVRR